MKKTPSSIGIAATLAIVASTSSSLHAQVTRSWVGNGNQAFPTAIWGGVANWAGGQIADGANNTALFATTFNNGYSVRLNTNRTLGFVTFTDPETLTDNNLIIRIEPNNSFLTFSATANQPAFAVTQSGDALIFEPRIAGTLGFAKNGPGRVVLTNPNSSYTGPLNINNGTLEIGGGIFTVSKGTDARAASPDTEDFDTGTLGRIGNGNYAAPITIATDALLFYNSDSDTILTGDITGGGALQKGRSGILTLTGENTYTGGTSVSGGILVVSSPDSLPDYDEPGEVVFDGGTIAIRIGGDDWTEADVDTLLDNATRTAGALGIDTTNGDATQWTAFDTTYLGPALGLTKFGPNTLTLNEINDYAGPTIIAGGILVLEAPGTIGDGTNDLTLRGGALDLGGQSITTGPIMITTAAEDGPTLANGSITSDSYTLDIPAGNAIVTANLLANQSIGLEKAGAGTATLTGTNTYTGDTVISAGTLLGGSGGTSASSVIVESGSTFGADVTSEGGQWTSTGDLSIAGDSTILIRYGTTTPSKTTAPIAVENLTLGEDITLFLPDDSLDLLEIGETYPVITWSGTGPADASDISFLAFRTFADLSVVGDTLFMTITASAPGPIAWNTGDGTWDTTTANWVDVEGNATTFFNNLDTTIFGNVPSVDANDPIAVTLDSNLSPVELIVDSTEHNYTLNGTGRLEGPAAITVEIPSTGIFSLGMNNTHTGGIEVKSGTLRPLTNQSLGPNNSSFTVQAGATVDFNGAQTANRDYHAFIAGDGVDGTGAVVNNVNNLQSGLGFLTLLADASIGSTTRWDLRPQPSGIVNLNGHNLTKLGSGKVALIQADFPTDGTITVNAGELGFTRNTIAHDLPVIVNNGATLHLENNSSGSFSKPIIVNGSTVLVSGSAVTNPRSLTATGNSTLQINAPLTIGGGLAGDGNINKAGTQPLTITGASTHTGNISVASGALTLGASGTIPTTATVRLSPGATLNTNAKADYTIPAGQTIEFIVNPAGAGSSGRIVATGLDVSAATATFDALGTLDDPAYIIATYTTLTGAPFANVTLPPGYMLDYNFEGNQIALVEAPPITADYAAWAAQFPDADLADPDADFDGDGLTNDQERLFGLDPTSSASVNPIVVPLDAATGTLSFTRRDPALTGYDYHVWTSTDLVDWTIDAGATLTPATPVNDIETVAVELSPELLDAPRLFVRIGAEIQGPLFFEDFEEDDGGFTVVTLGGTAWEHGEPNSPNLGGGATDSAFSGSKCWGTNLTGPYGPDTNTSLRSPVIDLTDVTSASLEFAMTIDALPGHTITVNIIEATSDNVIASVLPPTQDNDTDTSLWQSVGPLPLPAQAYGQEVRIEWHFVGDGDNFYNGVYIDRVVLTED